MILKTLSLTTLLNWSGLRDEGLFQRVESPIASSAHLTELIQLDMLLRMDFDSVNAFFTRRSSFRWETLCQNLMVRMIATRAVDIIPSSP